MSSDANLQVLPGVTPKPPCRQYGFTLIEVMVALAIFAVLALISYRTLSSIFVARERLQMESTTLRDQALFFARLENDLNALMPRAIKNADGKNDPALKVLAAVTTPSEATISFTRTGFAAGSGISAAPQRIGYRLKDNTVELLLWDGLDQAPRAEPNAYFALKGIREFRWRVLEKNRVDGPIATWRPDWPTRNDTDLTTVLPAALELTLTPATGLPLVRVFVIRNIGDVAELRVAG